MTAKSGAYQLVYFPYLHLSAGDTLSFGTLTVWDQTQLSDRVSDEPVRERVATILASHRAPSGRPDKSRALRGIGIVSTGADDFGELVPARLDDLQELRAALFLACLSSDATKHGPNAGNSIRTAENFSFVTQGFVLGSPYMSETSGVLVTKTSLGYKLGEVQFPAPSHVPSPISFECDELLLGALEALRRTRPKLFRRLLDATSLFIESYHNTPAVDIRARVLLQVAAFEVLLELPERQQRKVFKDRIEEHCNTPGERRFAYKFEVPNGKRADSRTVKGIWADRFYTLRNHIIHGRRVAGSEYAFRGEQHHVTIGPIFFVHVVRRLVELATAEIGEPVTFYSRVVWHDPPPDPDDPDEEPAVGFRAVTDYTARFADQLAAAGIE